MSRRPPALDPFANAGLLRRRLLRWYRINRRDLPWRRRPSPYRTLVAEMMLQQTRAATVIPYYTRFVREFPDLRTLAAADESSVLAAWEGLGYYRRARSLLAIARRLRANGGALPKTAAGLRELPGVGDYTAAAVASIAFGRPEAVVDGNVRRVLARLLALSGAAGRPETARETSRLRSRLSELICKRAPGDFNQGVMELGATLCTPRAPDCGRCPLQAFCLAYSLGEPERFPSRRRRPAVPERREVALIVLRHGTVQLQRHPPEGLLGGMWGLPAYPGDARRATSKLRKELGTAAAVKAVLPEIRHSYSHFTLRLTPVVCSIARRASPRRVRGRVAPVRPRAAPVRRRASAARDAEDIRWIPLRELSTLPMGRAERIALASAAATLERLAGRSARGRRKRR